MSFTTKLYLWCFAAMFGLGAVSNWDTSPVAAGMMFMLFLGCFALFVVARRLPFTPSPKRMHMDEEQARDAAQDIVDTIDELGCFHIEGALKVLCPICKTWCSATMVTMNDSAPGGGFSLGTMPGTALVQVHVDVTLHAHDHECVGANAIVSALGRPAEG